MAGCNSVGNSNCVALCDAEMFAFGHSTWAATDLFSESTGVRAIYRKHIGQINRLGVGVPTTGPAVGAGGAPHCGSHRPISTLERVPSWKKNHFGGWFLGRIRSKPWSASASPVLPVGRTTDHPRLYGPALCDIPGRAGYFTNCRFWFCHGGSTCKQPYAENQASHLYGCAFRVSRK